MTELETKTVEAGQLRVSYLEFGPPDGWPCIMAHGFPYDVHAFDDVSPELAKQGARVIVPWLRGYGPTRFLSHETPRSGEQAALAADLLNLMNALSIPQAVLGGYDWGGRACCIVSALWPERVAGLVTGNGYNIQDIATCDQPIDPEFERQFWYQYYFHSERGKRGLNDNHREIAHLLWRLWSPKWAFDEAVFEKSARAFDNPDFVEVVIHSYRHRFALVKGDPTHSEIQQALNQQPSINVPTIAIDGDCDGVIGAPIDHKRYFTKSFDYRIFPDTGHNLPQEQPDLWVQAVKDVKKMGSQWF